MNIQRLRNITTGILHTEMGHVYEDLEYITGNEGIMTHMIPRVVKAVEPWLREQVADERFWDGQYDPSHGGEVELRQMNDEEQKEMFARYMEMPNPLAGKQVIAVEAQ